MACKITHSIPLPPDPEDPYLKRWEDREFEIPFHPTEGGWSALAIEELARELADTQNNRISKQWRDDAELVLAALDTFSGTAWLTNGDLVKIERV